MISVQVGTQDDVVQDYSYIRGYLDGKEDSDVGSDSSPMLGMVIVAGFASAFWFCVGLAIGWAM